MVNTIETIRNQIVTALDIGDPALLRAAIQATTREIAVTQKRSPELLFLAGYATYMLPREDKSRQAEAESWMLKALIAQPGHPGAILYLAFIAVDRLEFKTALGLLFSAKTESFRALDKADRLIETRVYCLAKMGYWEDALSELTWFESRIKDDPACGYNLINFFRLIKEESGATSENAARVLSSVRNLLKTSDDSLSS